MCGGGVAGRRGAVVRGLWRWCFEVCGGYECVGGEMRSETEPSCKFLPKSAAAPPPRQQWLWLAVGGWVLRRTQAVDGVAS